MGAWCRGVVNPNQGRWRAGAAALCVAESTPSRSTKGQGQQRTAAAQQASGGGAAAGLGRGDDAGAARQPARPQNTYAKKEMQEVRVAPTSSAKWPIEITGDKEDAVIAEDCRTTTG